MSVLVLLFVVLNEMPETRYGYEQPIEQRQSVPGTHCVLDLERTPAMNAKRILLLCTGEKAVLVWEAPAGEEVEGIAWRWTGDVDHDGKVDVELHWVDKGNWGGLLYLSTQSGKPLLRNQAVSEAFAKRDRRWLLDARPTLSVATAQKFLDRVTRCIKTKTAQCWKSLLAKGARLTMAGVRDDCLGAEQEWSLFDRSVRRARWAKCMAVTQMHPSAHASLKALVFEGTPATAINRVLQAAVERELNARNHADASAFEFRSPWQYARLRLVLEKESLLIDDLVIDEGC